MKNTKAKLLRTAARLFASRGTEGVSTRELAGQAGVNLCTISYYFGSKQKLYEAVIDEVIDTVRQNLLPAPGNGAPAAENPRENSQNRHRPFLRFSVRRQNFRRAGPG